MKIIDLFLMTTFAPTCTTPRTHRIGTNTQRPAETRLGAFYENPFSDKDAI